MGINRVIAGSLTAGSDYPISSIRLVSEHNAIPYVEVGVDSSHTSSDPSDVSLSSFAALAAQYSTATTQVYSATPTPGSVYFESDVAAYIDTPSPPQIIEVKDWPITDVTLGGYRFGSGQNMLVRLSHPAIALQSNCYRTLAVNASSGNNTPSTTASDVIGGFKEALEAVASPDYSSPSSVAEELKTRVSTLAGLVETYLEWTGSSGWPKVGTETDAAMQTMMNNYITGFSNSTPWEMLARGFISGWGISILPDYTADKLAVAPYNPWAAPASTIEDTEITAITMPSIGSRISGVAAMLGSIAMTQWSATRFPASYNDMVGQVEGHIEDELGGTIHITEAPFYAEKAKEAADAAFTSGGGDMYARVRGEGKNSSSVVSFTGSATFSLASESLSFLNRYCKQQFCQKFLQDRAISIEMVLSVNKGIVPGNTCFISAGGSNIIKFLVTSVEHVVDCNAAVAKTIVNGAYAHGNPLTGVSAIPGGVAPNYVYEG